MADEDAAQCKECFVDVGAAFVADAQAAELVEPRDGPLHHPAHPAEHPQMLVVVRALLGQPRFDPADPQRHMVAQPCIRLVGDHRVRPERRRADLAFDLRNRINQRDQELAVGAIRARDCARERHAFHVGADVVLAARLAPVRGVRSGFFPAPTARTLPESTAASDRSISPRLRSSASRRAWTLSHTPAACQSRSRRQQVTPLPQPISLGSISQGMPARSTKRMPVRARRCEIGLRPGCRNRRGFIGGSMGSMIAHSSSSRIGLAIGSPPCSGPRGRPAHNPVHRRSVRQGFSF